MMIEKTLTPISAWSASSNCAAIILLYISTLQRRYFPRSTRKNTNSNKCPGPNERTSIDASTKDNRMVVAENRAAQAEPPPQTDSYVDSAFYLKLQATLGVIFVSGWGVFIRQFQFN